MAEAAKKKNNRKNEALSRQQEDEAVRQLNALLRVGALNTAPQKAQLQRACTEPELPSNADGVDARPGGSPDQHVSTSARPMLRQAPGAPRLLPPIHHVTRTSAPAAQHHMLHTAHVRRHSSAGSAGGPMLKRVTSIGVGAGGGGAGDGAATEPRRAGSVAQLRRHPSSSSIAAPHAPQPLSTTRTGLNLLDEATRAAGYVHRQTFEAPPATAALPPRGHLVFNSAFEGGNVLAARRLDDGNEYELTLRHDANNPKYRLWFHFQVSNAAPGQQVVLTITNFSKGRSLYRHGMTPVVRSFKRPTWCRVPQRNTFYYKSKGSGGPGYLLSWAFVFDDPDDTYEFAYSFPFTYTALQFELGYLEFLDLPYARRHLLARSPQLRRVDLLAISQPMFSCPWGALGAAVGAGQVGVGAGQGAGGAAQAGSEGAAGLVAVPSVSSLPNPLLVETSAVGQGQRMAAVGDVTQCPAAVAVAVAAVARAQGATSPSNQGSSDSDGEPADGSVYQRHSRGSSRKSEVGVEGASCGPAPPPEPPPRTKHRPLSGGYGASQSQGTQGYSLGASVSISDGGSGSGGGEFLGVPSSPRQRTQGTRPSSPCPGGTVASQSSGMYGGARPWSSGSATAAGSEQCAYHGPAPTRSNISTGILAGPLGGSITSSLSQPPRQAPGQSNRSRPVSASAATAATAASGAPGAAGLAPAAAVFPSTAQPRRVVVVTCRVHPGETPASYVVQGLVNFLLGPEPEAAAARSGLTWLIVPMLNPDGVFLGNYRCDAGGVDLNRLWRAPAAPTCPSLHHTLNLLAAYAAHPGFQVELFVDVHAHSTSPSSFLFCNQPAPPSNTPLQPPQPPILMHPFISINTASTTAAPPSVSFAQPQSSVSSSGAYGQPAMYVPTQSAAQAAVAAGALPRAPMPPGFGGMVPPQNAAPYYGHAPPPQAPIPTSGINTVWQSMSGGGAGLLGAALSPPTSSISSYTQQLQQQQVVRPVQSPPTPPYDHQAALERVMKLPRLMDSHVQGFSLASCVFDEESAKAGCARRVVGSLLPGALCYTLEVSFFHGGVDAVTVLTPNSGGGGVDPGTSSNTIEGYLNMGRGLGLSVAHLFDLLPAAK